MQRKGQTVLVTAAAGGTGQLAVQLAVLAGCTVIGTCSGGDKERLLRLVKQAQPCLPICPSMPVSPTCSQHRAQAPSNQHHTVQRLLPGAHTARRSLGCHRVINYRQESLKAVLKKEYPEGVDCVYESGACFYWRWRAAAGGRR